MARELSRRVKLGGLIVAMASLPVGCFVAVPAGASAIDGQADATAECAVERLPLPAGAGRGEVHGGDRTGRYLIGHTGDYTDLLWEDGELTVLPELPAYSYTTPLDVNSSGHVVGFVLGDGDYRAWRYVDGEYSWLPAPDGVQDPIPTAINSRGDIVGWGRYQVDDDWIRWKDIALYWPAGDPDAVRRLEGRQFTRAEDISDNGVIVGDWYTTGYARGGYVWDAPDRRGRPLLDAQGQKSTMPLAISGNGKLVVGYDDSQDGVRWNLETGETSTYEKWVGTVNNAGDVANHEYFPWPAVIERADGSRAKLAALDANRPRGVTALFERDGELAAAGFAKNERKVKQPVVWHSC